jgi:uncharacterized protein
MDTYAKTIKTLKEINEKIDKRWVAVRVNFDNRTLRDIEEIIDDIDFLDRRKTYGSSDISSDTAIMKGVKS